jgi:hypothetical protein
LASHSAQSATASIPSPNASGRDAAYPGSSTVRKEALLRHRSPLKRSKGTKAISPSTGQPILVLESFHPRLSGLTGEVVIQSSEPFGKAVLSGASLVLTQGGGRRLITGYALSHP